MTSTNVYIAAAKRTPVGKIRGVFRYKRPDDLLALSIQAVLNEVPHLPKEKVDDVIMGCAMPEGAQGMNVARISLLLAGLAQHVPGMTINRFCASGLQSIALAADRIRAGEADVIIAGGTESMSMVPMGGFHFDPNPLFFNEAQYESLGFSMGITAENVAKKWHISREAQDRFALESHERALLAIKNGWFTDEIVPVTVNIDKPDLKNYRIHHEVKTVTEDEGPRKDPSFDALQKLRPVFAVDGTVTAGNASQMSDGAAAVLVVSEAALKKYELTPLAIFHGFSVAGVDPAYMGIGPVAAIPKCLDRSGIALQDIDWIELNEAFASQSLAVMKELNLDPAKVNPEGGAIALGHPLGATGTIKTVMLIHGLKRIKKRYGMVTMCIGTGMGACGVFEIYV